MSDPNPAATSEATVVRPWWRERMLWLVVGGPALVVLASLGTAFVAFRGADVVVTERAAGAHAGGQAPALSGRNHAATAKP